MNEIHHTRRYHQPVSPFWWLRRRSYLIFALRELSAIFIAWFVVFLLVLVSAVGAGEDRYRQFLTTAANPGIELLNVISFFFILLHAITWFHLTPQAIALRVRSRRIARIWIVASLYMCWGALSWAAAWIIMS